MYIYNIVYMDIYIGTFILNLPSIRPFDWVSTPTKLTELGKAVRSRIELTRSPERDIRNWSCGRIPLKWALNISSSFFTVQCKTKLERKKKYRGWKQMMGNKQSWIQYVLSHSRTELLLSNYLSEEEIAAKWMRPSEGRSGNKVWWKPALMPTSLLPFVILFSWVKWSVAFFPSAFRLIELPMFPKGDTIISACAWNVMKNRQSTQYQCMDSSTELPSEICNKLLAKEHFWRYLHDNFCRQWLFSLQSDTQTRWCSWDHWALQYLGWQSSGNPAEKHC